MGTTQISVFLENKRGRLADVTRLLTKAGINIRALSLADTADFGVLRLIVDDPAGCSRALRENGFVAQQTEVVAVEVEDHPGGLHRILEVLDSHGINIEYMYASLERQVDRAVVVMKIDEREEAQEILRQRGIRALSGDVIRSL